MNFRPVIDVSENTNGAVGQKTILHESQVFASDCGRAARNAEDNEILTSAVGGRRP
jgi:hypothetical protein